MIPGCGNCWEIHEIISWVGLLSEICSEAVAGCASMNSSFYGADRNSLVLVGNIL